MKKLSKDRALELSGRLFSDIGYKIAYMYILFPVIIFLIGWCNWYVSLVGVTAIIYTYIKMCRNIPETFKMKWAKKNVKKVLVIFAFILFWVFISGIGKYVYQNSDHTTRNGIFEVLVKNYWPVAKSYETENGVTHRGLIYYIGFWMPSVVVGKIFGIEAGYFAQYVWAVLGVCLTYYLICVVRKKFSFWPFWILVFFSGIDIIGYYIRLGNFNEMYSTMHLEWWTEYQFSSFTTQLFWVFNQAIPAWVTILLLYTQRNNRQIVIIVSAAMLSSTIPVAGMIVFAIYFMVRNISWEGNIKKWLFVFCKDTLTFENIFGGGVVAVVCMTYLLGNTAVDSNNILGSIMGSESVSIISEHDLASADDTIDVDYMNQKEREEKSARLLRHIVVFTVEVGVYLILVFPFCKNRILFYLMCFMFWICPDITIGYAADFCMRASIPSLVLLILFIMEAFEQMWLEKKYIYFVILLVTLAVGAITPIHEMHRTILETMWCYEHGEQITQDTASEDAILQGANFSGPLENNFFYYYIAK